MDHGLIHLPNAQSFECPLLSFLSSYGASFLCDFQSFGHVQIVPFTAKSF